MRYLLLGLSWLLWAPVSAQGTAPGLEALQARMRDVSPKTVVIIFDITGSMESRDKLIHAREATIPLLREAVRPGDRVVLTTFDVAPKTVFDRTIRRDADLQEVIDAVPGKASQSWGTNIRWAHHQMLRMLEKRHPPHSYIVLVTDTFNDPPHRDDPHYADYLKYYTTTSLARYPDTPENRDYERLLGKRKQLRVDTLGIGVLIDEETGRPKERWAVPPRVAETTPTPVEKAPSREPAPTSFNPWWLVVGLAAAALLLFALVVLRPMLSAEDVTLVEGARQVGPFRMHSGSVVELGGAAHRGGEFGAPIPGTAAPVAYLRRRGGTYQLELAPAPKRDAPEVRVNGETVQKIRPLRFGDEIQVRIPRPEGGGDPRSGGAGPRGAVRYTFERYRDAASTV